MSVRANCPDCGDVSLANEDITVRPCVDDPTLSTYWFRCPNCHLIVVRDISVRLVELLSNAAAVVRPWFLPAELFEVHDGPPITVDDCIDFHQAMNP